MWKKKVETKEEIVEETIETKEETTSDFPKVYIHKDKDSELMFWNSKFSRWKVIITNLQEENKLKGTLDFQYWFISLKQ